MIIAISLRLINNSAVQKKYISMFKTIPQVCETIH